MMKNRICVEIDGIFYKSLYQAHLILGFDKKTIYTNARKLRNQGQDVVVDHKIPITRGGKHRPNNLRIVSQHFNLMKSNKLDSEL